MNVSLNWLRSLARGLDEPPEELARRLSLQAVAVDLVEPLGEELAGVVVGRVVSVDEHPDADRLVLCRVDSGTGEELDVVCGAPNVVEGARYPYVPPGATLPGGFEISKRKIRGIVSHGMLCSEKELGLGRDAAGIMRLADDLEPGASLTSVLELPDTRFVLDVTPNRVDLASHIGVARELAPRGVADIELPDFGVSWTPAWVDGTESAEASGVRVTIEDDDRCFRYLGAVLRDVRIGPSPEWLRARLRAAGARPVNNVVDATNYVLLELGQPLHAFDLARLEGPEIRVRAAESGETLTTLDGTDHELDPSMTVIADARRPVGFAGVMGGEESEVTKGTTDLLLECAAFDPAATRRTAAAAGLSTDASYRFERGIDERGLELALQRCVELILATAGGEADTAAIRTGRPAVDPVEVMIRASRVRKVLGLRLSPEQMAELLQPLGFETKLSRGQGSEAVLDVRVPTWRTDVTREIDVIEEIARRYGYERFPREARAIRPSNVPADATWARRRAVRRLLESHGLLEARGLPMVPEGRARPDHVRLLNPLSATESVLRTDLVPPLLDRVEHNFARGRRDVRLYEIGTVFERDEARRGPEGREAYLEEMRVAVVMTGGRRPDHWSGPTPEVDLWDLRGLAEEIVDRLIPSGELRPARPGDLPEPAPGRPGIAAAGWLTDDAFAIFDGEELVGVTGRVRAEALDAPPWAAEAFAVEFRLEAVTTGETPRHEPRPEYPAVIRDLALLVKSDVSAATIENTVRAAAPGELVALRPFDVYEGDELDGGRRSVAWRLVFRAADRTLTDDEVDERVDSIVSHLTEELDVRVRDA